MPILQAVVEAEEVAEAAAVGETAEAAAAEVVGEVKTHLAVCVKMHPVLLVAVPAQVVAPPAGLQIVVLSAVVLACSNFYE